ncbi:hypothetical protein [Edwardsiella tarda]
MMNRKIIAVLGMWLAVIVGSVVGIPAHAEQTLESMGLAGVEFSKAKPGEIVDVADGSRFGCQRGDFGNDIYCHIVVRHGDYLIYSNAGGVACPDNEYGVVNLKTNKGADIPADEGKCNGQLQAKFISENNKLYAITFLPTVKNPAGKRLLDF